MFERLTPEARKALFAARWVAEASGSAEICPEHLVTGILTVAPGCLSAEQSAAVLGQLGHSEGLASRPENPTEFLPFSEITKRCLSAAGDRTARLGHRWVRSEHVLAALLDDSITAAARALQSAGVTANSLETSALSRAPAETDHAPAGPTMQAFVLPIKKH